MAAAIYARISQDRKGEGAGVGRQIKDCRQRAEELGLDVVHVFNDNDVSAYRSTRRPAYEQMLRAIRAGEVDTVLAYHSDRLYRRFADLTTLIDVVEMHRVRIITLNSGDLDLSTASGKTNARILGAVAAGEVERKAERQARQKLERAEQGLPNGGRRPLGYERDGVTIDESRAPALREAAARLLSGHSLASCARYVSEQWGVVVKPRVLRDALLAPRIAGLRQYWSAADRARWQAATGRRSTRGGRPAEMKLIPAAWEGILSVQEWEQVTAVLTDPERHSGQSPAGRSLLGGFLTCQCGKGMGYSAAAYKCMKSVGGCGTVSCSTKGIETLVLALVQQTLEATDLDIDVAEPKRLDGERGRLEQRRDDILAMWRAGALTASEATEERLLVTKELARLDEAESESVRRAVERRAAVSALGRWEDIEGDTVARAVAIRAVFDGVRVLPSHAGYASGPRFDRSRVRLRWAGSDTWVTVD